MVVRASVCHYDPDIPLQYAIKDMRGKENRSRRVETIGKRKRGMKDSVKADIIDKEKALIALRSDCSPLPVLQDVSGSSNQTAKKRRISSDLSVVRTCPIPFSLVLDRRISRSASRSTSTPQSTPAPVSECD